MVIATDTIYYSGVILAALGVLILFFSYYHDPLPDLWTSSNPFKIGFSFSLLGVVLIVWWMMLWG